MVRATKLNFKKTASDDAVFLWIVDLVIQCFLSILHFMTYAIAWKTDKEVFLAADSAITTTRKNAGVRLDTEMTAFGRKNFIKDDKTKTVEEKVLKVFLKNNVGLTCAGYFPLIREVAKAFYEELAKDVSPIEALRWSLGLNPVPKDKDLQCAVGFYDEVPKILFFDSQQGSSVYEDIDLVQMGNPPEKFREMTELWIDTSPEQIADKPEFQLTRMLGLFQTYDLLNPPLLELGIGGVFTGVFIDSSGGHQQSDMFFVEYGGDIEKTVSMCVRHDCLVINSPIIGQSRCFLNTFLPNTSEIIKNQIEKAKQKGRRLKNKLEYEYILILSHFNKVLFLIEMNREKKHDLIQVEKFSKGKRSGVIIAYMPTLKNILEDQEAEGLHIAAYKKPSVKKIPDENKKKRIIKYD
ncbi:hypothetical protein ACFL0K_00650 [Patescibacteria group bacterium]